MSVDRRELHELVDSLPDDQVQSAADDLRRRTQPQVARKANAFAWVGKGTAKEGVTDLSIYPTHRVGFGRESR